MFPDNAGSGGKRLPGHPKKVTIETWIKEAEAWKIECETETVSVQIPKANMKTGKIIKLSRPKPPLIESFCRRIGIRNDMFRNYQKGSGYEAYHKVAWDIADFCTTKIMEYMMLGIISERAAIFYLVNNSRYADVNKIEVEISENQRPGWLSTKKATENRQLPGEPIEFEDVPTE